MISLTSFFNANFFLAEYEEKYYWWETVVIAKKMLLTGAVTLIGDGSSAQLVVGMMIVMANLLFTLKLGPFVDDTDDALSFLSSLQMFFTLLLGLLLKTDDVTDPTYDHQSMGVLLVLLSVLPFLALAASLALLHPKVRARANACCGGVKGDHKMVKDEQQQRQDSKVVPDGVGSEQQKRQDTRIVPDGPDSVRTWT